MSTQIESEILDHFDRGDKVFIGRSHTGQSKIKIKFGPFGLLTKRVEVDNQAAERLRELFRRHRSRSSQ